MFNKVEEHIEEINRIMRSPGLMIVSGNEHPNIHAINWASIGFFWGKPVFILALRKHRHTYKLVDESGVFTVNVPRKDMTGEILKVAIASGREIDKFSEFHLHPVKAKHIDTYVVGDCGLHLECRVIFKSPMDGDNLDATIKHECYEGNEYHTMFYAEILDIYES